MFKFFILLLSMAFVSATTRECPSGYTYAGDDNEGFLKLGCINGCDEVKVGPVYSCYKSLIVRSGGINEAIAACAAEKGGVVAFDSHGEIDRFIQRIDAMGFAWKADSSNSTSMTFLTSGMHFTDVAEWIYLGSNYSLPNETTIDSSTGDKGAEQCLAVHVSKTNLDYTSTSFQYEYKYFSVPCNNITVSACEVRVQMVTTYEWIVTNWILLGTGFIIMLLVVSSLAFCVCNVCCFSSPSAHETDNHPIIAEKEHYPVGDLPTYHEAVEVSGISRPTTTQKVKSKGKTVLSKLYIWS